jgi:hypothetical protein
MHASSVLVLVLLATTLVALPSASAGIPRPNCIQIYEEHDLGPVTIIQSGCTVSVRQNGSLADPCSWKPAWC